MSEEEKEAIERIQKRIKDNEDYSTNQVWLTEDVRCARVVLNLIQKQDKIMDKMAEQLEKCKNEIDGLSEGNIDCFIPNEYSNIDDCIKKQSCKECIKEYFKKVVE